MKKQYRLRFLPLFIKDLDEIVDYISIHLNNPIAAERLIDDVEKSIMRRLESPDIFAPYPSVKDREYPYYWIRVRNYYVFYVLIEDVMEVRRIIYSRRNISEQLK